MKLRKKTIGYIALCALCFLMGCKGNSGETPVPDHGGTGPETGEVIQEELSMKILTPTETNVKIIGRADLLKNSLWLVHSGSGAEFTFTGTKAVITLQADSAMMNGANEQARVAIFVNDNCVVDDMMNKMQKTYTVFESESEQT